MAFHSVVSFKNTNLLGVLLPLGKDPATKSDDFLENLQTAFDPALIFGISCCKFFIMDMVAFMQGGIGQIVSINIS